MTLAPVQRWPTSVCCYDGGVFVAASPDIFYFKDTDDDGVSDLKETKTGVQVTLEDKKGETSQRKFDKVLVAIGRRPNTEDLGLDADEAVECSAKVGTGIDEVIEAIVTNSEPPVSTANPTAAQTTAGEPVSGSNT